MSALSRYYNGINAILNVNFPYHQELLTHTGVYAYIKTQYVEFYSDNGKLALEEVPEIVFSEVMRDVDRFIQGCSIGLDLSLDLHGFPEYMLQYYQVGHPYSNS